MIHTRKAINRQASAEGRKLARDTCRERAAAIKAMLNELPLVMDRLHRCGLTATAQLMHDVVQKVGWEAAELLPELYESIGGNEEESR